MIVALKLTHSRQLASEFKTSIPAIRKKLAQIPLAEHNPNFGVEGNTFRAYQQWNTPPSIVYREWAAETFRKINAQRLARQLTSQSGFNRWHESLAESLQITWRLRQGKQLTFAHQYKLVDLFIKWLSLHDFQSKELTDAIVAYANCALDRQTLNNLNRCLSLALPISNPSMGDIHCRATYDFCQSLIGDFAATYDGTRLLFDHCFWKHGG